MPVESVLHPCDPQAATWSVPIERTRPEYPGAWAQGVELPMTPEVAKTFAAVLQAQRPIAFGPGAGRPLPPETAARFDFQSVLTMALRPKDGPPWQFGLHQCSYPRVWTPSEYAVASTCATAQSSPACAR